MKEVCVCVCVHAHMFICGRGPPRTYIWIYDMTRADVFMCGCGLPTSRTYDKWVRAEKRDGGKICYEGFVVVSM